MSKRLLAALEDAETTVVTDLDVTPFGELVLMPRYLEPSLLEADRKYQKRLKIDDDKIAEYAELWSAGVNLSERDPIVVFYIMEEQRYVRLDGWHRIDAWIMAFGDKPIPVQVATGTATQANAAAMGANTTHGIARTNEEKRAVTDEAILAFTTPDGRLSDRTLAKICGVSVPFVGNRRAVLEHAGEVVAGALTVTADGRKIKTEAIGTKADPAKRNFVAPDPEAIQPSQTAQVSDSERGGHNGAGKPSRQAQPSIAAPVVEANPLARFTEPMTISGTRFTLIDDKLSIATDQGEVIVHLTALKSYLYLLEGA